MTRRCELGMEIVENGNDLEDTEAAFGEDEKSRLESLIYNKSRT